MYPFEMMIDYLRDLILCLNVAASYTARIRGGKKKADGKRARKISAWVSWADVSPMLAAQFALL